MRKFILYTLSLVFILIVLLYSLDFFYSHTYFINPVVRTKSQYVNQLQNEKFDVVFLGSSRVNNHIDTQLINQITGLKTINLGVSGGILADNSLLLQMLIHKNQVKKVFLQVDHTYNLQGQSTIVKAEIVPFLTTNQIVDDYFRTHSTDYRVYKYIPFYRYLVNAPIIGFRELFFNLVRRPPRVNLNHGFTALYGEFRNSNDKIPTELNDSNIELENFKQFCADQGIELVLFTAPYSPMIDDLSCIDQLAQRIPNLKNYARLYSSTDYFYDNVHLNADGAKRFSEIIAAELVHE